MNPETPEEATKMLHALQRSGSQHFLSDAKLHEIFEQDLKWSEQQLLDGGGVMMTFGVHGRKRESTGEGEWAVELIVMADWPPPDKYIAMRALGMKYHEDFPDYMPMAVSQIAEAWQSVVPKDAKVSDRPMPSKDPKRIEVVLVSTVSMDQRQDMSMRKMIRNEAGKLARLEPNIDKRYEPSVMTNPHDQINYLILNFFMGYFASLGKGEK